MRYLEAFVLKVTPVESEATGAVSSRDIAALYHESRDHAVEGRIFETPVLGSDTVGGELAKVFRRPWALLSIWRCHVNVAGGGHVLRNDGKRMMHRGCVVV